MSHVYSQQIDDIVKINKIFCLESELSDQDTTEERKKELSEIIKHEKSIKNSKEEKKELMNEHLKVLKESQYKKKWQFLNETQKQDRLSDYIKRKNITDKSIIKHLNDYIKDPTTKSKTIIYDNIKGEITDITINEKVIRKKN